MNDSTQAIADGLFTWPSDDPHLLGSTCKTCHAVTFPQKKSCPRCCSQEVAPTELAQRGTLWTWTVQEFAPKSPPYASSEAVGQFAPFGIGYVELPGQVRVETRLTESDPTRLRIGMPMELTIVPFGRDATGAPRMIFAFRPIEHDLPRNLHD